MKFNYSLLRAKNFVVALLPTLVFLFSSNNVKALAVPTNFKDSVYSSGWNQTEGFAWDAAGQMYVWEKNGVVWVVDTNGNKLATPLLDISEEVGGWRDHGLNGFALDPDFRTNGYFYLFYTVDRHYLINFGTGSYNAATNEYYNATIVRLTRYQANAATNFTTVVAGSRFVLIGETKKTGIPLLHESHSGGQIVFGDDGSLLVSTGDGASYNIADSGSAADTYYIQGLADSIIRPEENCGAYRSQMLNSLNGKILRIDKMTGNGLPSNPYYDASNPRAPQSRVWALGLRNPFRMCIRKGTGSTDITAGKPGVLYLGDVGWATWEDFNVCYTSGMNFGWPLYEGLEPTIDYSTQGRQNLDAPNPLFGQAGCTSRPYFRFDELIQQPVANGIYSFPNPCNAAQQITSYHTWVHARPQIDIRHNQTLTRTGIFTGNTASTIPLSDPSSPVQGIMGSGSASVGGVWYTSNKYPAYFQNCYYHADYAAGWIRQMIVNNKDSVTQVIDFAANMGPVVFLNVNPKDGFIYYVKYPSEIHVIKYQLYVNNPPTAVATEDTTYGATPFTVHFNGSQSSDPENQPMTYLWNFGDGTATNTSVSPTHIFTAPAGVPTTYTITLTVTDNVSQTSSTTLKVYINNTPPQITITSPVNNSLYSLAHNTLVPFTANVTDAEHGPNQLFYSWQLILHHNSHTHPEAPDTNKISSGVVSPEGCTGGETFYFEIKLTVTDAGGLSSTQSNYMYPACNAPVAQFTANVTSICPGGSVNFTDQSSSLPDNYSWTFNGGTPSSSTQKNPTVQYNTAGVYSVTLSVTNNFGGTPLTKTNYINVATPLSATISPNGTITTCQPNVTLTANSGTGLTYQWQNNGTNIAGANSISYIVSSTGNYTVIVTNANNCSATSGVVPVNFTTAPPPITANGSTTICAGSSVTLSALLSSGTTYQWYRNGGILTGATSNTYAASSNGTYYCYISSSSCSTASNSLVISVTNNPVPAISYSTSLSFCSPGSVVLTANSFSGVVYQWQKNSMDISGATSQTYSATSNGAYRVKETANGCFKYAPAVNTTTASSVTSAITANGPTTFCQGGSVILSVSNAVPGYSYQWKNNNVNIGGATLSNYSASAAGSYTCAVSASCGSVVSNAIIVSLGSITATVNPSGTVNICSGATVLLSANTGTGYSYQWQLNGSNILGATSSTYTASVSGNYLVSITSPCGSATSAATTVNITPISATISPSGTTTICAGGAQTFTANTGTNYIYQWYRNGGALGGATSSSYTTSTYGNFSVIVSQGGVCSATSAVSVLNVTNNPAPTITAGGPTSFCAGQNVTLTANTFSGVIYQWQKNGTDIPGATAQSYIASATGSYRVKETANGCIKSATAVAVSVNCRIAGTSSNEEVQTTNEIETGIIVQPNPFSTSATLLISNSIELKDAELVIFDILGNTVKRINHINDYIVLLEKENLHAGIYMIQLKNGSDRPLTSRIIITE
jgi:PKD repeat protein/glucose/arabinose dehydrogenase